MKPVRVELAHRAELRCAAREDRVDCDALYGERRRFRYVERAVFSESIESVASAHYLWMTGRLLQSVPDEYCVSLRGVQIPAPVLPELQFHRH